MPLQRSHRTIRWLRRPAPFDKDDKPGVTITPDIDPRDKPPDPQDSGAKKQLHPVRLRVASYRLVAKAAPVTKDFANCHEKGQKVPRFAILAHDWPARHFDLLLENQAVLLSWRLSEWPPPSFDGGETVTILAERIGDHRSLYLDYEGPISGNRGSVHRVDDGTFVHLSADTAYRTVELNGRQGCYRLSLPETGQGVAEVRTRDSA